MKTVTITEDFEGYPNGKDVRTFRKGETVEVADTFADLIVEKGHAHEEKAKPKGAPKTAPKVAARRKAARAPTEPPAPPPPADTRAPRTVTEETAK